MVFSICVHELGHAVMAYQEGDDTAKNLGYFTLNPMVHMGSASLVLLFLVGICWGACPVNPSKFKKPYSDALVSFAGPMANLLLLVSFALMGVLLSLGASLLPDVAVTNLLEFSYLGAKLNAALFLLNMLPLPPLDGHVVWASIFPPLKSFYAQVGNAGFVVIMMLFWLPIGFSEFFWDLSATMARTCYGVMTFWV